MVFLVVFKQKSIKLGYFIAYMLRFFNVCLYASFLCIYFSCFFLHHTKTSIGFVLGSCRRLENPQWIFIINSFFFSVNNPQFFCLANFLFFISQFFFYIRFCCILSDKHDRSCFCGRCFVANILWVIHKTLKKNCFLTPT